MIVHVYMYVSLCMYVSILKLQNIRFQNSKDLIRNLVLKTFVIKVNAIKLSTFRCRLDTIIKIKVEGNGRS